jgi:putative methyltransferase (TIGR04325 family)
MNAPIALFVYSRLDHTRRTVESVLTNPEAADTDLIIFSDSAKTADKEKSVADVRAYLGEISGFRSVAIHERPNNFGLAKSITSGVTQVLNECDSVVVLEDDMVVSPYFLRYMNDGLKKYAEDEKVASIHGYVYPVAEPLPETFFLRGADCWGWATWRRAWKLFNPDGRFLLGELERQNLIKAFDFNSAYGFSQMLQGQLVGKNDSWAVRWHASAFLANKLTLYPGRSLVHNIGNDSSGTHCGTTSALDAQLSDRPIQLKDIDVKPSKTAEQAIERFFRTKTSKVKRVFTTALGKKPSRILSRLANDWLPPVINRQLRRFVGGGAIRFEGPFGTWAEATQRSSGYDSQEILDKVLAATLKVKNGEAAYERDSVLFDEVQYSWPVTAALMYAAARNKGRLSVLDFGGSLGSSYFQNREFLKDLIEVRWSVIEQPHFVEAGRKYIQDERLRFFGSIDEYSKSEKADLVVLSSVLQYLDNPHEMLQTLLALDAEIIILDLTIVNSGLTDIPYIQKIPSNIYSAEYPAWSLSAQKLGESLANANYQQVSTFKTLDFPALMEIKSEFKGFFYERKSR